MKYILEIKPEYEANGIMILGARDSHLYVTTLEVKDLEELNSDYINEHYGDLQDEAYQRDMMDEEIRQALTEVQEMKKMCGNINMKLTNIVTQRGQDWKKKLEAEYQRGLDDAWEAARKLFSSMADSDIEKAFPIEWNNGGFYALMNLQPQEAIEKLKSYEEKQKADDEIKVGDEVYCKGDDTSDSGVVTWVGKKRVCAMWQDGSAGEVEKDELIKTNRHFDIASILKEMQS